MVIVALPQAIQSYARYILRLLSMLPVLWNWLKSRENLEEVHEPRPTSQPLSLGPWLENPGKAVVLMLNRLSVPMPSWHYVKSLYVQGVKDHQSLSIIISSLARWEATKYRLYPRRYTVGSGEFSAGGARVPRKAHFAHVSREPARLVKYLPRIALAFI